MELTYHHGVTIYIFSQVNKSCVEKEEWKKRCKMASRQLRPDWSTRRVRLMMLLTSVKRALFEFIAFLCTMGIYWDLYGMDGRPSLGARVYLDALLFYSSNIR